MNHDQHHTIRQIDADLDMVRNARQLATAERDRAALAVRIGTDKKAPKELAERTAEIAGYDEQLSSLAGARRAAVEAASASHHGARAELLAQHLADARAALKQRVQAAAAVEKAIDVMSKALTQHAAAGVLAWDSLTKTISLHGSQEAVLSLRDGAMGSPAAISQQLLFALQRSNELGGCAIRASFDGLQTSHDTPSATARAEVERVERVIDGFNVADDNAVRAPVTPAVRESVQRTAVIDGTTQVVGLEGSEGGVPASVLRGLA